MKVFEYSARTIQEAIDQGLEELGVAISDVTVDVLEEGSKGLFGLFGSRPAKVRITMKDEADSDDVARSILADAMKMDEPKARKQEKPQAEKPAAEKEEKADKSAPKPRKPREPKAPKDDGVKAEAVEEAPKKESKPRAPRAPKAPKAPKEPVEQKEIVPAEQADRSTAAGKAQEFLQELTRLMGVNVSVAVKTDEEGNVRVDMEGDTLGILIGRRGETLDALQYLTSLQVNKGQNDYTRVTLDTEGYRAKREEALVRLANRMANRAQ
ncbi:MAG: Jag N-terminal domain-containing protein [Clostridia bacterium]|nr:Jag N-terminal domain-containing protein [Clostridia bacterium]